MGNQNDIELMRRHQEFLCDPRIKKYQDAIFNIYSMAMPIGIKYCYEDRCMKYIYSDTVNELIAEAKKNIDSIINIDYADLFPPKNSFELSHRLTTKFF